jgi:hypothetical protein
METSNLGFEMKELYLRELATMPGRHRLKTDECPPLEVFEKAASDDWPKEYREHAPSCKYCQMTIAKWWRPPDHPSLYKLGQHALGILPDKEAIRIHLEVDECTRCKRLLKVKALVEMATSAVRATGGKLRAVMDRLAVVPLDLEPEGASFASTTSTSVVRHGTSDDGNLTVTVTAGSAVEVHIESPSRNDVGRNVRVDLYRNGRISESWTHELEDRGEFGAGADWLVGARRDVGELDDAVASWAEEEP